MSEELREKTRQIWDGGGWTDEDWRMAAALERVISLGLIEVPAKRIGDWHAKLWVAARIIAEELEGRDE